MYCVPRLSPGSPSREKTWACDVPETMSICSPSGEYVMLWIYRTQLVVSTGNRRSACDAEDGRGSSPPAPSS